MTAQETPRVTAIVPAYKSARFIGETLDSLAAQTWDNLEILVGDDASPDDTAEVVRTFAERHPNARVVLRPRNMGWIANTNDLMAQATGEFLFYMPHDDLLEPTYVERLAGALADRPQAIIAYSDLLFGEVCRPATVHSFDRLSGIESGVTRASQMLRMPYGWWVPHRGVFRARAFRAIGGLRPAPFIGQFSADFPWLVQMAALGGFVRVPEVLYHKRWMPESLSRNWTGGHDPKRALLMSAALGIRGLPIGRGDKAAILAGLAGYAAAREAKRLPITLRRVLGRKTARS